ncbi:MAG: PepSY domain-containing protein [Bacteroidales bacterium]|nr:PepSY domain-containing protein [Bacteroidales bacterium]
MIKHLKKYLFLIHKWTGFVMSLLFVVWFISGFIMIYHSFPKPRPQSYFHGLSSFSGREIVTSPQSLTDKYPGSGVTLEILNGQPIYRFTGRKPAIYNAYSLKRVQPLNETGCRSILESNFSSAIEHIEVLNDFDQWIPWSYYKVYFPIYKYKLKDKAGTHVYVSSTKGQIVQETTRQSRLYAWLGAIPHWVYFKNLRLNVRLWSDVVIWLSAIGCFVCLSGIIIGFIRLKRRAHFMSPYKKETLRWHHLGGLIFGCFVFTFILSGLMSLTKIPDWIIARDKSVNYYQMWNKQSMTDSTCHPTFTQLLKREELTSVKQITFNNTLGRSYYSVYSNDAKNPDYYTTIAGTITKLPKVSESLLEKNLKALIPHKQYKTELLSDYNSYYRYNPKRLMPLPVYEVALDDTYNTRLYIDHQTGELVKVVNNSSLAQWWLYQGLHTFKFGFFSHFEGIRQAWLILISLGGTIVSLTALLLFVRFLKRKTKRSLKKSSSF